MLDNFNGSMFDAKIIMTIKHSNSCDNNGEFKMLNNIDGLFCCLYIYLNNIIIRNSITNKNNETSKSVGIYGLNINQENITRLSIHNITISQSNDVIVTINIIVNIENAGRFPVNNNVLSSVIALNYNGVILDYFHSFMQILTNILRSMNWTNDYTAPKSTAIIIIKETGIVSECYSSYLQKDTLLMLYNNYFNNNSDESKLIIDYCATIDHNNITGNASHFTNSKTSEILISQLHVSGNENQDNENDCKTYKNTYHNIVMQNNLKGDCDISNLCLEFSKILNVIFGRLFNLCKEEYYGDDHSIVKTIRKGFIVFDKNLDLASHELKSTMKNIRTFDIEGMLELFGKTIIASKQVDGKDICLVLGRTGAGKSTTTYFIAGLTMVQDPKTNHIQPVKVTN